MSHAQPRTHTYTVWVSQTSYCWAQQLIGIIKSGTSKSSSFHPQTDMVTAAGIQALNCTYVTEFVVNQKLLRRLAHIVRFPSDKLEQEGIERTENQSVFGS